MNLSFRARFSGWTIASIFGLVGIVRAESAAWTQAYELYQKTEYHQSLEVLQKAGERDISALLLTGQNLYMLADYKRASDYFERAVQVAPDRAEAYLWLGRSFGRRAEVGNPLTAPGYASKARQNFERAVRLAPNNRDAVGDLFDYYLEAPGFLGGGQEKAEALAATLSKSDPAESHYYQAILADRRKQYDFAEQQFREAMQLAPKQVSRIVDLAKYVAKRGRTRESEALFDQAVGLDPNNPRVMFERASTYVREQRNLPEARRLLERYIHLHLKPDDPPRQEAEALLKKIGA